MEHRLPHIGEILTDKKENDGHVTFFRKGGRQSDPYMYFFL